MKPEILNPGSRQSLVLVCDHASRHIPAELESLGLSEEALSDHIAWDIGAGDVVRHMADMMKVPAVLAGASRLLLDTNRDVDDPTRVPVAVDGYDITGNRDLDRKALDARHQDYYVPFHDSVDQVIDDLLAAGTRPVVVAIHSFSPVYEGFERPWQIGLMWDVDPRLAQAMIGLVERETDLVTGANEPWSGKDLFHTMKRHGEDRGLLHTGIEIRNDLLRTDPQKLEMAALLADLLDECMQRDDLC